MSDEATTEAAENAGDAPGETVEVSVLGNPLRFLTNHTV
jgi:hypothetical protein